MLNRYLFSFLVLLALPSALFSQSNWGRSAGGLSHDEVLGMDTNDQGNLYTCGYFNGLSSF